MNASSSNSWTQLTVPYCSRPHLFSSFRQDLRTSSFHADLDVSTLDTALQRATSKCSSVIICSCSPHKSPKMSATKTLVSPSGFRSTLDEIFPGAILEADFVQRAAEVLKVTENSAYAVV